MNNDYLMVSERANMPTTEAGIEVLKKNNICFLPGKAANAGGVLVSGLEMAQNSQIKPWTFERINTKLKEIMELIFDDIYETAKQYNKGEDMQFGVNIFSFKKLADAMIQQGIV